MVRHKRDKDVENDDELGFVYEPLSGHCMLDDHQRCDLPGCICLCHRGEEYNMIFTGGKCAQPNCLFIAESAGNMKNHYEKEHDGLLGLEMGGPNPTKKCDHCDLLVGDGKRRYLHISKNHPGMDVPKLPPERHSALEGTRTLDPDIPTLTSFTEVKAPAPRYSANEIFVCSRCDYPCFSQMELQIHFKEEHMNRIVGEPAQEHRQTNPFPPAVEIEPATRVAPQQAVGRIAPFERSDLDRRHVIERRTKEQDTPIPVGKHGLSSTQKPNYRYIPKEAMDLVAETFARGQVKHPNPWNGTQKNYLDRLDEEWVITRLEHVIGHATEAIAKILAGEEFTGEEDAGAILFGGCVYASWKKRRQRDQSDPTSIDNPFGGETEDKDSGRS